MLHLVSICPYRCKELNVIVTAAYQNQAYFLSSVIGREVSLSSLRIPGVLQRLAVSYFVVAAVEVFFAQAEDIHQVFCLPLVKR